MPSEHEYERAAHAFRAVARHLDDQAARAPRAPASGFVTAGPTADAVDAAQRSAIDLVVRAADELRRLAHVCERRAEVCRAHRRAVRVHDALPAEIRAHTAPPAPPAPWVEP